ncbi:MAG: acyltransferase [Methylotenera sp.]|nr:acyltransferase [Methylotenera sp.]MDO9389343.1 acyltransferase [Methylotenera sp.]
MSDSVKQSIIKLAQAIWSSDDLCFVDTERTQGLREDILRNFLALAMTDDERAQMLGLSHGCRVRESAKIISPQNLTCGENVWIGENVILDASGGLEVGSHTTFGVASLVWTHSSSFSNIMMDNRSGNPWIVRNPTRIGSGCYIGGPSSIYPGVTIGNKVIVLPMSVVTEDVPDNVMVGGSPAKVIRSIDADWMVQYQKKNGLS